MKTGNEMNREELIDALKGAFSCVTSGALKEMEEDENLLLTEVAYKSEKLEKKAKGNILSAFGWLCIGYMVSASILLPIAMFLVRILCDSNQQIGLGAFLMISAVVLSFAIGFATPAMRRKSARKKYDAYMTKKREEFLRLDDRRKEYISSHPEIFGFMPVDYATSQDVAKLLEYVVNMRAESLKEAINLLEQEEKMRDTVKEVVNQAIFTAI